MCLFVFCPRSVAAVDKKKHVFYIFYIFYILFTFCFCVLARPTAALLNKFDKYMNEYKRSHPELTDLDLPRFEDMDHNNNGHINFHEVRRGADLSPGL